MTRRRKRIAAPLVQLGQDAQRLDAAAFRLAVKPIVLDRRVDVAAQHGVLAEQLDRGEISLPFWLIEALLPDALAGAFGQLVVVPRFLELAGACCAWAICTNKVGPSAGEPRAAIRRYSPPRCQRASSLMSDSPICCKSA